MIGRRNHDSVDVFPGDNFPPVRVGRAIVVAMMPIDFDPSCLAARFHNVAHGKNSGVHATFETIQVPSSSVDPGTDEPQCDLSARCVGAEDTRRNDRRQRGGGSARGEPAACNWPLPLSLAFVRPLSLLTTLLSLSLHCVRLSVHETTEFKPSCLVGL